jgi:hypothetical protein
VLAGQGPAIHLPGEEDISLERSVERDRSAKMQFGSLFRTTVCTDEFNMFGPIVEPGNI